MSKHGHGHDDVDARTRPGSSPPVRWIESAAAVNPTDEPDVDVERRIGDLLAKLPKPPVLTAAAEARVGARLQVAFRRQAPPWRAWYRRPLVMGWGLGAALLLLSGAVIAGGGVAMWWTRKNAPGAATTEGGTGQFNAAPRTRARRGHHADVAARDPGPAERVLPPGPVPQAIAPAGHDEPAPAAARRRRAIGYRKGGGASLLAAAAPAHTPQEEAAPGANPSGAAQSSTVAASPPVETSGPPPESSWIRAPEPPPAPAPAPYRAVPMNRGSPPAPQVPSQLSQEARLLNAAMVRLRQHRDGAGALTALDDYLQRYPRGMLAVEARRARIDALLLLQRKDEALRALDSIDLEPVGRGQELLVIRGELRGRRDCAGAVRDFEAVLGGTVSGPLQERALFGRAVCRLRGGDEKGARADARTYLDHFPAGRFSAAARRLTGGAH